MTTTTTYEVRDYRFHFPLVTKFPTKRRAKKLAKKIGPGSLVVKRTHSRYVNPNSAHWSNESIHDQPARPMLKNGHRMDYKSYFYNYVQNHHTFDQEIRAQFLLEIENYASPEQAVAASA